MLGICSPAQFYTWSVESAASWNQYALLGLMVGAAIRLNFPAATIFTPYAKFVTY